MTHGWVCSTSKSSKSQFGIIPSATVRQSVVDDTCFEGPQKGVLSLSSKDNDAVDRKAVAVSSQSQANSTTSQVVHFPDKDFLMTASYALCNAYSIVHTVDL